MIRRCTDWIVVIFIALIASCSDSNRESAKTADRSAESTSPWFEECAEARSIRFVHESGFTPGRYLFPETVCGGAALFDADNDGDLDALLVQAGSLVDPQPAVHRLFLNRGDGHFDDVTEQSGLVKAAATAYGMGATAGDYDNDGDVDLYITCLGPNMLLRNDGVTEGVPRFTDVALSAGVDDDNWSSSSAFVDYDADGNLDLFVVNYIHWSIDGELTCPAPLGCADYCHPTRYAAPARDTLFRNNGDGTFTDISIDAGLNAAYGNGLGVVCGDFNGDQRIDIFVANDAMPNQLWINRGDGRFIDEAGVRGCATDDAGRAKAGMGVDARDLNADGRLDLLVVNLQGETDSLYRNTGDYFVDGTASAGLGVISRAFTRFGTGLVDFNNDCVADLYEANGRVRRGDIGYADDPYAEPNVLFRGTPEGKFIEVQPRGGTNNLLIANSRAAAFGDIDNDGGIDILICNRDGPAHLLRNVVADRGNWISFRVLNQHGSDALGASLAIDVNGKTIHCDVRAAYSYCATNDPRVHLGLGTATRVDRVTVRWPDGFEREFGPFESGQIIELHRRD